MSRARPHEDEIPLHDLPTAEEDRLPGRTLWLSAGVAAIVTIASVLVADAILHADRGDALTMHAASPARAPDQLGLVEQTLILDTRRGLVDRAAQRESLDHFGWSDRAHGLAKIPIDRAIDLVTDPAFVRRAYAAQPADAGSEGGR